MMHRAVCFAMSLVTVACGEEPARSGDDVPRPLHDCNGAAVEIAWTGVALRDAGAGDPTALIEYLREIVPEARCDHAPIRSVVACFPSEATDLCDVTVQDATALKGRFEAALTDGGIAGAPVVVHSITVDSCPCSDYYAPAP